MRRRSTFSTELLLILWAALAIHAPPQTKAAAEWARATPADAGLDESRLNAARDYALTGGGSGCIVRGGKMVFTWGDQARRYDLKSTTKSFGAAALGLAIMDTKLRLEDKARAHHPTLGTPPDANAQTGWLDEITILHLASQTAGFDKNGGYTSLLFRPGAEWCYSDGGPNWLAECITLAYRRDVDELMFERLFTPIGIERGDIVWRKNQYRDDLLDGIKRREFGSGISANVDAMARFGLLWLRGGEWNGQRILPREFIDKARATIPGVPGLKVRAPERYGAASSHYGLLWWNNADETIEGLPLDTYWTWGLGDQLIFVMPTLDMVVARAGQSWKRVQGADHYEVLKPFLLPIVAAAKFTDEKASASSAAPYPPSPVIRGIEWAPRESIVRMARGSDNWPIAWADDDALYTAYGDGRGFEPFVSEKLSLGLAKVTGTPPDIRAVNLRSESAEALGDGKRGRKASGMLCVDGVLHLLVRNAGNSQLGWSADRGATWTWADWKFTESFGYPTFLNFGRDYAGARDEFVYLCSHDSDSAYERADRFVMARAPKGQLRERSAWEFFVKLDAGGAPQWSADIARRGAVFSNPGACYRSSISYDAGLKRYLWCQIGRGSDTRYSGGFAIYDAPEPWGPWTTAFHVEQWDTGPGESSCLPTKWMSADGRTLHLVFSGDDHFSVRRGVVALRESRATSPPRDGDASVTIGGELKQWHNVVLTLDGPFADERDDAPNPFTDLAFNVTFTHESGAPSYTAPGYFAADGDAANTSAGAGTKWRAHLSPDKPGKWSYAVSFKRGPHAALDGGGARLQPFDGAAGAFTIAPTDKTGRDFRAHGRLQYVGGHHLRFAGSKEYFLKAGADAPETLLAYADFDNTLAGNPGKSPLKTWQPHVRDWQPGDPTWKDGKGKGLIGALNYLSAKGANAFSFLTYNAGGDGDNVWPFISRGDKLHYDCSKLDQWGIVFDHATARGLFLHFKMQENEMDDDRRGQNPRRGAAPESLDGGRLGPERKLYCRELIARFGHALALNWNIGEENTQSREEVRDMVKFIHDTDPYRHPIVIHTFPNQQEKVYPPLLGEGSLLAGASLQNSWSAVHRLTLRWLEASAGAGRPWVVANDEQNPAGLGVPPDPGYAGHDGIALEKNQRADDAAAGDVKSAPYTLHDIRKLTLWGHLMAGGAGVEYYFGYQLPQNDLACEDWRSRDRSWDYCRIALEFFRAEKIPFWEMKSADALIGNAKSDNSKFCFAKAGAIYLVYLPDGTKAGPTTLDLRGASGSFTVKWFNPRTGGALMDGSVKTVGGGGTVSLGQPPADPEEDWLAVIR